MQYNMSQNETKNEVSFNFRESVAKLEKQLIAMADGANIVAGTEEDPIVTDSEVIPIRHFFMDGIYVREMTMFQGVAVIGAIHKHLHMCFLLKGHLTVASEAGTRDYVAPCYIIAEPGEKRVLYAHEDSVWYNTHNKVMGIDLRG